VELTKWFLYVGNRKKILGVVYRISTMLQCKISECNVYFLKTGFLMLHTHFLSFLVQPNQPPQQIPLSQKTNTALYISFYVFNGFGSLIFFIFYLFYEIGPLSRLLNNLALQGGSPYLYMIWTGTWT